jgi:H+/Cl- antiporter ClcA
VPLPIYFRLALAGLIVGAISIVYPEVCGNGYSATNHILHNVVAPHQISETLLFILGLLAAKFVATASTVGSGTVGGVFTPTLFLGAGLGSPFWDLTAPAGNRHFIADRGLRDRGHGQHAGRDDAFAASGHDHDL